MSLNRFYCENLEAASLELVGVEAHHAGSVMRIKEGESVELFDGRGGLAVARVKKIGKRGIELAKESFERIEKGNRGEIIIACSVAKGERFDLVISKCTELGVDRIWPVIFERTVKQPANPKIMGRWQSLAISAAKQCKRLYLPRIDAPAKFSEAIVSLKAAYPAGAFIYGSLSPDAGAIPDIRATGNITAFIGPEGGFTDEETALLDASHAMGVKLTATVLRIETAAIAMSALLTVRRDSI